MTSGATLSLVVKVSAMEALEYDYKKFWCSIFL